MNVPAAPLLDETPKPDEEFRFLFRSEPTDRAWLRPKDMRHLDRLTNASDTAFRAGDDTLLAVEGSARNVLLSVRPALVRKFLIWWLVVGFASAAGAVLLVGPHNVAAAVASATALLAALFFGMRRLAFPVALGCLAVPFGLDRNPLTRGVSPFPRADGQWAYDVPVLWNLLFDVMGDRERQLLLRLRTEPDAVRVGVLKALWEAAARAHYEQADAGACEQHRRVQREQQAVRDRVRALLLDV